jgi:hypothetical protein
MAGMDMLVKLLVVVIDAVRAFADPNRTGIRQ